MKKTFIFLVTCLFLLNACNKPPAPAPSSGNGKLGDVKYSVLDPEKFVKENGKSWVLMDGRNISNSDLFKLTGMSNIPDGRGMFVRGMNLDRTPAEGDPDGNREIGKSQPDQLKSHAHNYSDAHFAENICGNQHLLGNKGDSDPDNGRCTTNQITEATGGAETRPRNIALYIYIKINTN